MFRIISTIAGRFFDQGRPALVLATAATLTAATPLAAQPPNAPPAPAVKMQAATAPSFAPDRVLVKFKSGVRAARASEALANAGVGKRRALGASGVSVVELVQKGRSVHDAIEKLRASGTVEHAEPDYLIQIDATTPSDPRFGELWGLHNVGQTGGTVDADADGPEAWDLSTGDPEVVVAVIDTGVDYTHEDLADNMWRNPGETFNGLDDDGNGYVDDVFGINAILDDGDPLDDHSHGTHVAGTIGAVANNGRGVAGMSWHVKIMALKSFNASGRGLTSDAVQCLEYARRMKQQHGVNLKLTSNSWGGAGLSQFLADEIAASGEAGILFVAAAGNDWCSDTDTDPHYPSSYDLPNIIAVAATDADDELASFSHYGPTSVDLGAPGVTILSTTPGHTYRLMSGTSMATPHVSGAAALLWARNPQLDALDVKAVLLSSVDPLASLEGRMLTGGRLNAFFALLSCEVGGGALTVAPPDGFVVSSDGEVLVEAALSACATPITGATVSVVPSAGDPQPAFDDGGDPDAEAGDGIYTAVWVPLAPGPVTLDIEATWPGGALFRSVSGSVSRYRIEEVPFEWIDATQGTNTGITGDDAFVEIPIGFPFAFYAVDRTTVKVSSNGYLVFGAGGREFSNTPLPSSATPNGVIAPYWDDLNPAVGGTVYYLLEGTAPNRSLTIEWNGVPYYSDGGSTTFEVTLYEGSDDFEFRYLDVEMGVPSDSGGSATVGIEGDAGQLGLQYSFNEPAVFNQTALRVVSGCVDTDADGVCDAQDNCLETPNPDQRDTNLDGFGNVCDADFDGDGLVGLPDRGTLLAHFGFRAGDPQYDPDLDVNGDGDIGNPDLGSLKRSFGLPPGPSGLDCAGTIPCSAE